MPLPLSGATLLILNMPGIQRRRPRTRASLCGRRPPCTTMRTHLRSISSPPRQHGHRRPAVQTRLAALRRPSMPRTTTTRGHRRPFPQPSRRRTISGARRGALRNPNQVLKTSLRQMNGRLRGSRRRTWIDKSYVYISSRSFILLSALQPPELLRSILQQCAALWPDSDPAQETIKDKDDYTADRFSGMPGVPGLYVPPAPY